MATDPNTQVLTGWKAIAGYIRRDERTAMRWAAYRGLPVRRVPGGKRGPVYAIPAEIAMWLEQVTPETIVASPCDDPLAAMSAAPLRLREDDEAPVAPIADLAGDEQIAIPAPATRRLATLAAAILTAAAAGGLATAAVLDAPSPAAAGTGCANASAATR